MKTIGLILKQDGSKHPVVFPENFEGDVDAAMKEHLHYHPGASEYEFVKDENLNSFFEGPKNQEVLNELALIDQKKIRAITDAILTGDNTRLAQLEEHAALLRPHLKDG